MDDLGHVKEEFHSFYQTLFSQQAGNRPKTNETYFSSLSESQFQFIQAPFTPEEIKRVVWDCGSSKGQGPDDFSFDLLKDIGTFWRTMWWLLLCISVVTLPFLRDAMILSLLLSLKSWTRRPFVIFNLLV